MTSIFGERADRKFYGEGAELAWREGGSGLQVLSFAVDAGVDSRLVTRAACAIARAACVLIDGGEDCAPSMVAMRAAEHWAKFKGSQTAVRDASDRAWQWVKSRPSNTERMAALSSVYASRCAFAANYPSASRVSVALALSVHSVESDEQSIDAMMEADRRFARFVRGVISYDMVKAAMEDNP